MGPQQLLDALRDRGVVVTLRADGRVHFRHRSGVVTDELRQALVDLKPEVMSLLGFEAIARVFPGARVVPRESWDRMPDLPEDVRYAIGFGYSDGEPGTWDVLREGRRR